MSDPGTLEALCRLLRDGSAPDLDPAGWSRLIALSDSSLVTPALWPCVLPDTEIRRYVAAVHIMTADRNRALCAQLVELGARFGVAGIAVLLLKGAATLPELLQDRAGDRLCSDLDVAVRPADLDRAREALRSLGYWRYGDGEADGRTDGTWVRPQDRAGIDLHLRIMPNDPLLPVDDVWRTAELVPAVGPTVLRPDATRRVAHLVLHEMIHHGGLRNGWINPRALLDLRRLAQAGPDWNWLSTHFRRCGVAFALDVFLLAADRLMGVSWPLVSPPGPVVRLVVRRLVDGTGGGVLWRALDGALAVKEALAGHHMRRLYGGTRGGLVAWRLRHVAGWPARLAARRR